MYVYCGVLVVVTCAGVLVPDIACQGITIGAIASGPNSVHDETIFKYSSNVTVRWHLVDMHEVFHVYRAVQLLDKDESVFAILLLEFEPLLLKTPDMLATSGTPLITLLDDAITKNGRTDEVQPTSCDEILPTSVVNDAYCSTDANVSVNFGNMEDPGRGFMSFPAPEAVASLVTDLHLRSVYLLHETATESESTRLTDLLSQAGVLFARFDVDAVSDLHALYDRMYAQTVPSAREIYVVVMCTYKCVRRVLQTANAKQSPLKTLKKMFSRWLVVLYGHNRRAELALKACANDLDNVAILAIPEFKAIGQDVFREKLNLLLLEWFKKTQTGKTVDMNTFIIDKLTEASRLSDPRARCQGYSLDTLLWTAEGRAFSPVGYVDPAGRVHLQSAVFPNTRHGYNRFLVSTLEEVDMTAAPLTMHVDRERVMDFTYPFYHAFTTVLIRKPDQNARKWRNLIDPFKCPPNIVKGLLDDAICQL